MSHPLFSRIGLAYMSVFIVIALLIGSAHLMIQLTLLEEIATRNLASTMALQELRTQDTFRNSLLAILPANYQNQLNALTVDPTTALQEDLSDIEGTNKALLGSSTPAPILSSVHSLQPSFQKMDTAGHLLLQYLAKGEKTQAALQVACLFPPEQLYLAGVYKAYQELTQSANSQINQVMVIECVILIATFATLCVEASFIAWPLLRDHQQAQARLEELKEELYEIQREKEAYGQETKGDSASPSSGSPPAT
jgi:hypothetical protein